MGKRERGRERLSGKGESRSYRKGDRWKKRTETSVQGKQREREKEEIGDYVCRTELLQIRPGGLREKGETDII